jgi:D-alanine-D-alanine ligase
MHIAIVHNAISPESTADEQDVLVQADAVVAAVRQYGHDTRRLACDLDLAAVRQDLSDDPPDLVFNLVESLAGTGRLLHLFPGLLDALRIPYTGASAEALFLTSNKILAKGWLAAANMPTPAWTGPCDGRRMCDVPQTLLWPERWIIKSVWEHASIGLDANAFLDGPLTECLPALLAQRAPLLGGTCFAEAFIEGREFNLSVLEDANGPRVLPPAEIVFEGFGENQPHIVDYRAKWDENAFEYQHTPRRFDFDPADESLLDHLKTLALQCWHLFGISGYARVDFRVDAHNRPWILEVNANPCLSPDAGFAAAAAQAGMAYAQVIAGIVQACSRRSAL